MKLITVLLFALPAFAADAKVFEIRKAEAKALLQNQDYKAALEKATAINRDWADDQVAYQLMAAAQLGLGQYDEAEKSVQWMLDLRIGKADAQGWFLVSRFREVTGDVEGAIEAVNLAYNRAFPVDMVTARALLVHSAHLQREAGKLAAAEKALKSALATDSANESAQEELALLRAAQGRQPEAIEILQSLAKSARTPRVQYELANLTKTAEDYKLFESAALLQVNQPANANHELVLYYIGPGKRPAEAERVARIEAARRKDIFTLDALAAALWANGKPAEGKRTMVQTLAVGTRNPEILSHAKLMRVETE